MSIFEYFRDLDSDCYIAMADGRYCEVMRPYANRVLAPLLAHYVGFPAVQVFAFLLLAASTCWLMRRMKVPLLKVLPLLLTPWLINFAFNIYMADLLVMALTMLFFAVFAGCGPWLALPILMPMIMARESSAVIAIVWLCLLGWKIWKNRDRRQSAALAVGLVAVTFVAKALVGIISADSPGVLTELGLAYLPAKAFAGLVFSTTGCRLWIDTYALKLPDLYTHAPLWKMACPEILRLGNFTEIGVYDCRLWQPVSTLKIVLLGFGAIIPYAISRRRSWKTWLKGLEPWAVVAVASGLVFWVVTPCCSYSPHRYIGYAWPLLWFLALPHAVGESPREYRKILVAHVLLVISYFLIP